MFNNNIYRNNNNNINNEDDILEEFENEMDYTTQSDIYPN